MKRLSTITLLLITSSFFSQTAATCGLDDDPKLTKVESDFLNEYISAFHGNEFDFTNKKIIFVQGNSGQESLTKSSYFKKVKKRQDEGGRISTWVVVLTQEEQMASGYDAIISCWVKLFTERRKRKMLKNLTH